MKLTTYLHPLLYAVHESVLHALYMPTCHPCIGTGRTLSLTFSLIVQMKCLYGHGGESVFVLALYEAINENIHDAKGIPVL
jgi:hypothetical protein